MSSNMLSIPYTGNNCHFFDFSLRDMNMSSANVTMVIEYRDSLMKAVTKNVIVVVLSISINYINVGLIQTFHRHQVQRSFTSTTVAFSHLKALIIYNNIINIFQTCAIPNLLDGQSLTDEKHITAGNWHQQGFNSLMLLPVCCMCLSFLCKYFSFKC